MSTSSPTAAASASQAGDEDVEEGDDGIDDTGEDGSDSVDDGHETSTDGAEHACDLERMLVCILLCWKEGWYDLLGVGSGRSKLNEMQDGGEWKKVERDIHKKQRLPF